MKQDELQDWHAAAGCFWQQQLRRRGGEHEEGKRVIKGMTDGDSQQADSGTK
jgi:hypothetical protein